MYLVGKKCTRRGCRELDRGNWASKPIHGNWQENKEREF